MPSNTPPSKNPSPLSIHENRSQDSEEPPTDLSKFNMKSVVNDSNNNSSSKNNSQQFCLRWNNYQTNLTCVFDQLLQSESFVDVTLACDGNQIKAHKIVLSACSPYFQSLFFDNPCQHPIIIMRDVKWPELKAIVEFMYKGEINVNQDQISPLLAIAEMLQIRGLAEVNSEQSAMGNNLAETQIKAKIPSVDLTAKSRSVESSPVPTFDIEEQISQQIRHDKSDAKKARITPRDWESMASVDALNPQSTKNQRKRRWPSGERNSMVNSSSPENLETSSPLSVNQSLSHPSPTSSQIPTFPLPTTLDTLALQQLSMHHPDELEIKPGIAEMIREEERVS
jgi:BTB/POZ domain